MQAQTHPNLCNMCTLLWAVSLSCDTRRAIFKMQALFCRDVELAEVDEEADMLVEGIEAATAPIHDDDADLDMLAPACGSGQPSQSREPVAAGIIENTVRLHNIPTLIDAAQ